MPSFKLRLMLGAPMLLALSSPAFAADPELEPQRRDTVVVTGVQPMAQANPATTSVMTAETLEETTTVVNAEDALRYFPNILVRKRHIGDTQAPITTRTSGVGASARSLIYADGVLLSALIGNNNSFASPKWGMVSPQEIDSVSVSYGPFSAAYAGNSIGAVVEIETRMPDDFEAIIDLTGSQQRFEQYATKDEYNSWQAGATLGDRIGPFAYWLSFNHTDSDSQPLQYITATTPAGFSAAGTPVTGAFLDVNRAGVPIAILGAGGLEHQEQDNIRFKAEWDITPQTKLAYSIGRFTNDTASDIESYLGNVAGADVFAGAANIQGRLYTIAATAFSNNVYRLDEEQWSQSLSLTHRSTDGRWEWRGTATGYIYDTSEQRTPTTALPAARSGGAGSITRFDGTGWQTLDLEGIWRPDGRDGAHELSFGAHGDRYELTNERFTTTNWLTGSAGALASSARGKTQAFALWAQDAWDINDALQLIVGGRHEWWKAYDGFNFAPPLIVNQPEVEADEFSPKASLKWNFAEGWSAKASVGKAYRFPTVGELYQSVTAGADVVSPNPDLKPENALSTEWSLTRDFDDGQIRLTWFTEDLKYAIISQTAPLDPLTANPPLPAGTVIAATFIQNIDKVESRGWEIVADKDDVLIEGLSLWGSVTYVEATTVENDAFPAAVGKRTPQVPEWRATAVATYRPNDQWAFTLAGRYVDDTYGTIDNSDRFSHTFQGFEGFMTWDARVTWRPTDNWTAAIGVENLFDADYFLFHPFPQRAVTAELQYRF